jgi:hypothetical protein
MAQRQVTVLQEPPGVLVARLRAITTADDVTEARRRNFAWLSVLAWVLAVGIGFAGLGTESPLLLIVGALFLAGAIAVTIVWSSYRAADLDDARLSLATDLVSALATDFSNKSPVQLDLRHGDLFRFGTASNQRAEGSLLAGRVYRSEHEDTWFSLRGRMQDRSGLRLAVTTTAKRKQKRKRKYTKVTDRMRDRVTLSLRLSAETYPHLDRLRSSIHPQRLSSRAGLQITDVQVRPPIVRVTAVTGLRGGQTNRYGRQETEAEQQITGAKLVALLALVYAGLTYCRAEPATGKRTGTPT